MAGEVVPAAFPTYNASNRLVVPVTFGPTTVSGTSSATDASSLTDSGASFTDHALIGLTVYSNGSSGVITENAGTSVTVASWTGGTPTAVKPYMVAAAGIKGPIGTVTLGTISASGLVLVRDLIIHCDTTLTAVAATSRLAFGVVGSTSLFLGTGTGNAALLTANKFWESTGALTGGAVLSANMQNAATAANVVATISGENILTGALTAYIYWDPISSGATLT